MSLVNQSYPNLHPLPWELRYPFSVLSVPRLLWLVAVTSLCLYAFCKIAFPSLGRVGEMISVTLGLFIMLTYFRESRRDPAFILFMVGLALQLLSWMLGKLHHPELIDAYPKLDRIAKLFIFMPVAFLCAGSVRNTLWLWVLASAGFFVAMFVQGDGIQEWQAGLRGERVDGIRNAQHTSMFLGTMFLGLLAFAHRSFMSQGVVAWRFAVWLVMVSLVLVGLVITQTRGVWLGVLAAAMAMLFAIAAFYYFSRRRVSFDVQAKFILVLLLLMVTCGAWLAKDTVGKRLVEENEVIQDIWSGNVQNLPLGSITYRIKSWSEALEAFKLRPLIGWGGNAGNLVMQMGEFPNEMQGFGHLHSSYFEILAAYGLAGVLFFVALWSWLITACWRAWRGQILPGDFALFGVGFLIYWLVVNIFESYIIFWTGVFTLNIVLGGFYTHYWQWRFGQQKEVD